MIDAREARIVYKENEYKNQIRELLQAREEERDKINKYQYCETLLEPVYDKIAEASADGYNRITLSLFDFCYRSYGGRDTEYYYDLDVRGIPSTVSGYDNMPTQRHNMSHLIKEVLNSHGYKVSILREYWGYNEYDELEIIW